MLTAPAWDNRLKGKETLLCSRLDLKQTPISYRAWTFYRRFKQLISTASKRRGSFWSRIPNTDRHHASSRFDSPSNRHYWDDKRGRIQPNVRKQADAPSGHNSGASNTSHCIVRSIILSVNPASLEHKQLRIILLRWLKASGMGSAG